MELNMLEAPADFSSLLDILETGQEDFITIARNGKPVAKLTLIDDFPVSKRIGIAKGKFNIYGDFDADNEEIAEMFSGGTL